MNSHALEVLDLRAALELVAERASSALGSEAVRRLRPSSDREWVISELERVSTVMEFFDTRPTWAMPPLPDPRAGLDRLRVEGAVLEAVELYRIGMFLEASRIVGEALDQFEVPSPLRPLRSSLVADPEVEGAISRTVDSYGEVLDTASKELRRIRGSLRAAHGRIVRTLERYVASLPPRFVVEDASVTVREGRYVIPVRREGRGHVGGVVHDESSTGATVFVEPPVAVESMNELRDLERAERREIQRILRSFSDQLRARGPALRGALHGLIDFDSLQARARTALSWRAEAPEILPGPGDGLRLVGARHPGLIAKGVDVVPYDLRLDPMERTLVVSGPNTGGKSVFLKAVGLIALLTQSGVVPPVRRGTAVPVFRDVYADIGDEQSIAESLSTFSAHLENLREILETADAGALVLIDEMGTGTDPTEGAALSRAILEELTSRGALSVVTSHLGALKTLDSEGSGVVNASLHFDSERMEPTYRLAKGRPGRSYGLAIARRLGLPQSTLERAQVMVDEGSASLEDLLERLERQEREAAALVERLRGRDDALEERERGVDARESSLRDLEREVDRKAREEARELLLAAREEVEEAIREVRRATPGSVDQTARQARQRVEEEVRRHAAEPAGERIVAAATPDLAEGVRVRMPGGSTKGTVIELRAGQGRAVIDVGGLRLEVAAAGLVPIDAPTASSPSGGERSAPAPSTRERGWAGDLPDPAAEIDLRGLRVDEVGLPLGRGLDAAVLGGLQEVRIIHGKGTGAVRARTQELLTLDGRVREFRLGVHGEGGSGVTVVRLA
jgi:DNA mismatch repair protein MutS2